jgi:surface protein
MSRGYHASIVKIPAKPFISTWDTNITYTGSTANNQIKLPLISTGVYKFTVDWGDSTTDNITVWNQPEVTHTYAAPGTYTVTITGFIKGWDFSGFAATVGAVVGDRQKLLSIIQFGCLEIVTYTTLTTVAGAFFGCTNLSLINVQDQPNFKNCTSIAGFLWGSSGITTVANINKWDVSKVTFFRSSLRELPLFNDNVGNWNMSRAINLGNMFRGSVTVAPYGTFNNGGSDSIKNWDTSNVTDMAVMFGSQPDFNQEIGLWDVSNVTTFTSFLNTYTPVLPVTSGKFTNAGSDSIKNWNTGKVTNMNAMFSGQALFNQPIDTWDTTEVTNMSYMLQCLSFNQPLNSWDTKKVTTMTRMLQIATTFNQPINNWEVPLVADMFNFMYFSNPLYLNISFDKQNYSDFLINLSGQTLQPNVSLNVNQYYNSASVAARAILTSAPNNWTIVDLGLQP